MSNKRITELTQIYPVEIANNDLFAIADVSVPETKKVSMSDVAQWVGASASLSLLTSSYSKTASYLLYSGYPNGTASYAISSSWAYLAYSASYVISSSYSVTASYALTCSYFDGTLSGAFVAVNSLTASHLLYSGYPNGTASYAITASTSRTSDTASYVRWTGGTNDNGTVYRSISASYSATTSYFSGPPVTMPITSSWSIRAITSSFLYFDGVTSNGTASYAMVAKTASLVQVASTVNHSYIFREFGPYTSSLMDVYQTTASFGYFQITASADSPRITVEAWGDVYVPMASSSNQSGSLLLNISESATYNYDLDRSKFWYYVTGSDVSGHNHTGSVIARFYLKGSTTAGAAGAHRYLMSVYALNGLQFVTGSTSTVSGIRCSIKANTDNFRQA